MEVRFVSDEGIQQHPVGELEQLLARDDGLVGWTSPSATRKPPRC
jgi:hypothetical protein